MAQSLDTPLVPETLVPEELGQDFTFAPAPHPPVLLPSGVRLPGMTTQPTLGFAPAPAVPATPAVPAGRVTAETRPLVPAHPQRWLRLGWYDTAMLLLFLSCAALCCYRLLWAIQP